MKEIKSECRRIWNPLIYIGIASYSFKSFAMLIGSLLVSRILELALCRNTTQAVLVFSIGVLFSAFVFLFSYLLTYYTKKLNIITQDRWRGELSKLLISGEIAVESSGAFEGRAEEDCENIAYWYGKSLPSVIGCGFSVFIAFISLLYHDWLFSIVILAISAMSFIPKIVFEKWAKKNYDQEQSSFEDYIDWVEQGVNGAGTIKSYSAEKWYMEKFSNLNKRVLKSGLKA